MSSLTTHSITIFHFVKTNTQCQGIIACSVFVMSLFGSQNSAITSPLSQFVLSHPAWWSKTHWQRDYFKMPCCFTQVKVLMLWLLFKISSIGMAAEIQPPGWLWSKVLFLPHVQGRGLNGVETVLHSGSFKQVRQLLNCTDFRNGKAKMLNFLLMKKTCVLNFLSLFKARKYLLFIWIFWISFTNRAWIISWIIFFLEFVFYGKAQAHPKEFGSGAAWDKSFALWSNPKGKWHIGVFI